MATALQLPPGRRCSHQQSSNNHQSSLSPLHTHHGGQLQQHLRRRRTMTESAGSQGAAQATGRACVFDERSESAIAQHIHEINSQVAQFRDLLISIGQPRDCPELREKIRKLRRNCVEACKSTSQMVLPQMRSAMESGIPADSPNLVLLFFLAQLFLRELYKSKNLIRIVPMDMTGYFESKSGPSNISNVITQILLCKQITLDFNEEELCSIQKDSEEISGLIAELQEFMPQSEADTEKPVALQEAANRLNRNNGARKNLPWENRPARHPNYLRGTFKFFCCAGRPNYL